MLGTSFFKVGETSSACFPEDTHLLVFNKNTWALLKSESSPQSKSGLREEDVWKGACSTAGYPRNRSGKACPVQRVPGGLSQHAAHCPESGSATTRYRLTRGAELLVRCIMLNNARSGSKQGNSPAKRPRTEAVKGLRHPRPSGTARPPSTPPR